MLFTYPSLGEIEFRSDCSVHYDLASFDRCPLSTATKRTGNVRTPRDDQGMNTAERHERNAAIVAARKSGERTGAIAERFGLTDRHTRRVLAEHRADPNREIVRDPAEILEATLAAYEEEASRLAVISHTVTSDTVRLSAIKARLRILDLKAKLVLSVGLMPPPETVRYDRDVVKFAKAAVAVFDRYDVPEEAFEEIMRLSREATGTT